MSFNLERAALRGKLADAQERARRLTMRIEGHCTAIRQGLNTALTPVIDLEVPQLAEQMSELTAAWGELQAIRMEILRLERELH